MNSDPNKPRRDEPGELMYERRLPAGSHPRRAGLSAAVGIASFLGGIPAGGALMFFGLSAKSLVAALLLPVVCGIVVLIFGGKVRMLGLGMILTPVFAFLALAAVCGGFR